ncbi:pmr-1 [Pristionchus pacificus]|uniref:Calcium-transporting ATPase n=1 Tax=Pristionchus pacificus TaxID=54126 RepID=A0A2A6BL96_PRIPA|nr:pmr-1 [Pristionchus pacificus]|eukprot:PDM66690.1 pmr-1 [Pristionchus pacificus]
MADVHPKTNGTVPPAGDRDAARPFASLFRVVGGGGGEGGEKISAQLGPTAAGKEQKNDIMIESLRGEHAAERSVEEVCAILRADAISGLSSAEAARRRGVHGYNEFDAPEEEPLWKKYAEQFKNPLIALLLCSALVSILMKQFDDAISITVAVVIVVSVGFVQEYRSEKTLEQLGKLVPPTCTVIRDGREVGMLARELIPGDLVLLHTGDRVPADLRLVTAVHLQLDESSLTGETEPKRKQIEAIPVGSGRSEKDDHDASPLGGGHVDHLHSVVFMGTLVCSGHGKGIVISTATNSQFGDVYKLLQAEESPKTPLQKSMDQLGTQLSIYSFGIIAFIFVVGLVQGRRILDMFTIGVSLAVAAIPEGLPIVVAVTLAIGVIRMAKRRAVVKKMPAVETLGCVTVICSDKTGTLTKNEMTAVIVITPEGDRAEVSGIGYSSVDGVCTLRGERVIGHSHPAIGQIVEVGCVCNNAKVDGETVIGQPTEGALIVLARKTHLEGLREQYRRLQEIPFTTETKWMAVCAETVPGDVGSRTFFVKGAVDRVLEKCEYYLRDGIRPTPLDDATRRVIMDEARNAALTGLRVLGLARGTSLSSLVFVGCVGMLDPPRPGADEAIAAVKSSGVDVKLITGDSMETAQSIGNRLGIYNPSTDTCLSGHEVDRMSDSELELVIRSVTVFYRASPRHKLKIIKALQNMGEVVAMTGDGVNDAAALKKADIGVAMGKCGTDVCKEAADMILCDDDFSTLKEAIEEGKGIYHNITNFVRFQLSTSVAALSLIAASTIFHFENPLNAMQILWINIIMDGPPAQSLGVEPVDADIIRLPPRNTRTAMLSRKLVGQILSSAAIIVAGTLWVFYKEMSADNEITPRDTTMTFTCFVLFDMWNALSCRSATKAIWEIGLLRNRAFCLSVSGSLICQLAVIYWTPLQHIFQTEALTLFDLIFLTALSSTVFIFNEARKWYDRRSANFVHHPQSVNHL